MKILLLVLLAVVSGGTTAQVTNPTLLSCSGEYYNLQPKYETKLTNVLIKISNDEVIVSGIPNLGSTEEKYNIIKTIETHVFLYIHSINTTKDHWTALLDF